jgi:hypothetical protein
METAGTDSIGDGPEPAKDEAKAARGITWTLTLESVGQGNQKQ